MEMTWAFGRRGRGRGRDRMVWRADRRLRPAEAEGLEDRRLLSNIVWVNEFDPANDFAAFYGQDTDEARAIVNQAISDWERVIKDFNYQNVGTPGNAPQTNTFRLSFTAAPITGRGATITSSFLIDQDGKPFEAAIELDDDAEGKGWYFDTVPGDNAEFTDLENRFTASFSGSHFDFYRTVVHEIGHALGLVVHPSLTQLAIQAGGFLSPAGTDQVNHSSTLSQFNGTFVTATFTSLGGGHLYEGPADPSFPNAPTHPDDLMNAGRTIGAPPTTRELITDTDARILQDAYGYTLHAIPTSLETFLFNLNATTKVLTVSAEPTLDPNFIAIIGSGSSLNGSVLSGDGSTTVLASFPAGSVSRVNIRGGNSKDTITVDGTGGTPVSIHAGNGIDFIRLAPFTGDLDTVRGIDLVIGGGGPDAVELNDRWNPDPATYSLSGSILTRTTGSLTSHFTLDVMSMHLIGGDAGNTFIAEGTMANTTVSFSGGNGADTFRITPTGRNLNTIAGTVGVSGKGGTDSLEIDDRAASAATYALADGFLTRTGTAARIGYLADLEGLTVNGGGGSNTFNVKNNKEETHVTLVGGAGSNKFVIGLPSANLNAVAGHISVGGGGSPFDALQLYDGANPSATTYTIAPDRVTRVSGPKTARVDYAGLEGLSVFGDGPGGNTFLVEGTPAETFVAVLGGAGADTFRISPTTGLLANLAEMLTVDGGGGLDSLDINDSMSTVAETYVIADGVLSDLDKTHVNGRNVEDVSLYGGAAGSTFLVQRSSATTRLRLFGGAGGDAFRISPTAKTLATVAGPVDLSGGGGADSLLVDDGLNSIGTIFALDTNQLTRQVGQSSTQIGYSGIEGLAILGGTGGDLLSVDGVPSAPEVVYDPGIGADAIQGLVGENVFDIARPDAGTLSLPGTASGLIFAATETLLGRGSADTFRFRAGARVSGLIDGRGGLDTLDYSALATAVAVDLAAGSATATGGVLDVEIVLGGSAADILTGDDAGNILLGNGGADTLSGGAGADVLAGGDGDDVVEGGLDRDVLIGGRGADLVRGEDASESIVLAAATSIGGVIPDGFDDDLLVGGSTDWDADLKALVAIRSEWISATTYEDRVGHLLGRVSGGANGKFLLQPSGPRPTVIDDAIADLVHGGAGRDWFLATAAEPDDRQPDEFLN